VLLGGLPFFLAIGVVVPLAGMLSLVKSWREAKKASNEPAPHGDVLDADQSAGRRRAGDPRAALLHLVGVPALWSTMFAVSRTLLGW
jgi:hypothetical protein